MREILFREKTESCIEGYGWRWATGSLILATDFTAILEQDEDDMDFPYLDGTTGIIDGHVTMVIPATIGQYTGLKDKNGQRIFEGDIVQAVLPSSVSQPGFVWPIMPVVFEEAAFGLMDYRGDVIQFRSFAPTVTFEVKGNIHDNPDLLKEESK